MRLLSQIIAFVLLALWLPATQHCNLDAAGLVTHEVVSTDCCETDTSCADDSCDLVEGYQVRTAVFTAKILSPDLAVFLCVIHSHLSLAALAHSPTLTVADTERPIDWLPTWQFSHRTAPPARAPTA